MRGDWWFGNTEQTKGFTTLINVFTGDIFNDAEPWPAQGHGSARFQAERNLRKGASVLTL